MSDTSARPRGRSRLPLLIGVVVVAIAGVAALAAFAMGGRGLAEGVFFRDDFSQAGEAWSLDSYKGITTEIDRGGYRVELGRANVSAHDAVSFDAGQEHEAVVVSASATLGTAPDGATVGLTCGYAPGDAESITGLFGRYQAEIGVDGSARILRILNADEVVLGQGRSRVSLDEQESNALELSCVYRGDVASIALDANGERVIEAQDPDPFETFESAGMYAATDAAGLEVVFDDLEAARPGG